jgi:hypothetical protein
MKPIIKSTKSSNKPENAGAALNFYPSMEVLPEKYLHVDSALADHPPARPAGLDNLIGLTLYNLI